MSTKTLGWTLASDLSKKNPLTSGRDNSTYLVGRDEPSCGMQKGLEKKEASIHRFEEIYCIKQPR